MLTVTLWLTTSCNLKCTYCYEGQDKPYSKINNNTVNGFISFIFKYLNEINDDILMIDFHGGEPLLEFNTLKYIISVVRNECKLTKKKVIFGLTTNGTLISKEICDYLYDNQDITVSISIDGIKACHDKSRKYSINSGSYDDVVSNCKVMIDKKINIRARMTFDSETVYFLYENIVHLIDLGFKVIAPSPNFFDNRWNNKSINTLSKELLKIKSYYKDIIQAIPDIKIGIVDASLVKKKGKCNGGVNSLNIFIHLLKLKINYFNNTNNAEILNRIDLDISNITSVSDGRLFFIITKVFGLVGGIIGLFIIDYKLSLIVLIYIPIKIFFIKHYTNKRRKIFNSYLDIYQKFSQWFGDTIGGIKEIRFFGLEKIKYNEMFLIQDKINKVNKDINMIDQWNGSIDNVFIQTIQLIIYIIGALLIYNNNLTVGSVLAFITYSTYVTNPISAILNVGYLLSGVIPSVKRYFEFMNIEEEDNNGKTISEEDIGDIKINNVSFSFDGETDVFKNLNFNIPKSSKIALLGANGSGKTTLINILLRMYDPSDGNILINSKNIKTYSIDSYRKNFSIVNQQIYLFNDTIRNNIRLYKEIKDEEILQICEECGFIDLVNEKSLDYQVGENGIKLSGGERQKIALARALIHNKNYLILDEATSNTDIYSISKINKLIKTKLNNKTVIIVTHKIDVLKDMDIVLLLKDGEIKCYGTYDNLVNSSDDFCKMLEMYNQS